MKMTSSSSSLACMNTPNMFKSLKQSKKELLFYCSLFITGGIIILCPSFYSNTSFSTVKESFNETFQDTMQKQTSNGGNKEDCDYSKGKWVWDTERNIYNSSEWICPTRPTGYNCEMNGKDLEYLNWRWKPDGCELPKFEPYSFLNIIRGKTLAFVGDSLSLNQLNSLLCLVSQVEKPIEILDEMIEGKFFTWSFPLHEAKLDFVWSRFLVEAKQIVEKGELIDVYEVHLDKINTLLASLLPKFHYLVISNGNWWFSKKIYLHEGGKLIGCINCKDEKKLTKHDTKFGLQKAFRTVFQYISKCEDCKEMFTLLRTYSPSHFENGSWFDGGYCRRSHPLENEEDAKQKLKSQWRTCEEFREVQLEELGRVKRSEEEGGSGGERRKRYGVVDVSRASMLRVDAHPGFYYSNLVRRNVTDCLHWCMPGPPDMWNEILLEILKKDSLH